MCWRSLGRVKVYQWTIVQHIELIYSLAHPSQHLKLVLILYSFLEAILFLPDFISFDFSVFRLKQQTFGKNPVVNRWLESFVPRQAFSAFGNVWKCPLVPSEKNSIRFKPINFLDSWFRCKVNQRLLLQLKCMLKRESSILPVSSLEKLKYIFWDGRKNTEWETIRVSDDTAMP